MLANFPAHLDEKVKESFIQYSKVAMEQSIFNKLFNVNNSNDYSRAYTSIEGGEEVDYFAEQENLKDVNPEEGYEAIGVSEEFGGKITITKKEKLNAADETTLFNKIVDEKIPSMMARMRSFIERQGHGVLNDAFTGAVHLSPDGNQIIGPHTWKSTGAAFDNRSATNIVAGEAALQELEAYAGAFTDAHGIEMPLDLTTLWVKKGGSADRAFRQTLSPDVKLQATTIGDVNIYNNGTYILVATPYMSSDTAWFAQDRTKDSSLIMDFIQAVQLEERQTRENLTDVFPSSSSFRFGNFLLLIDLFGSDGSGS